MHEDKKEKVHRKASSFTPKSYIEERANAWVECDYCYRGKVIDTSQPDCKNECPLCNGDGGKWNDAVKSRAVGAENGPREYFIEVPSHIDYEVPITRSTILYQLYDPCGECDGEKKHACMMPVFKKGQEGCLTCDGSGFIPCPHCLKDSNGATGAADGTGQGWEVEK